MRAGLIAPIMRNPKTRRGLMASVLVLAFTLDALAQEARYAELPHFHQVNSQVYRGAQPKPGGLQVLKAIGIKTIVNLRGEDDRTRAESEAARALGLRYYGISLPEFSGPKDKEVQQVLDIITAPDNQPVFVHCRRGADRTGAIIACYRILHDGWNAGQAKKEAESLGMSWIQVGMKRYIDRFYKQRQKARVGSEFKL
jgi:tyrosine-protein phosphatase SIW14